MHGKHLVHLTMADADYIDPECAVKGPKKAAESAVGKLFAIAGKKADAKIARASLEVPCLLCLLPVTDLTSFGRNAQLGGRSTWRSTCLRMMC